MQAKNVRSVPYYYIPEKDVAAGPARIDKEREDSHGFWLGTIRSGARTAEAQGYDKGPLQGFIKVKVSDIGQSSSLACYISSASTLTSPL